MLISHPFRKFLQLPAMTSLQLIAFYINRSLQLCGGQIANMATQLLCFLVFAVLGHSASSAVNNTVAKIDYDTVTTTANTVGGLVAVGDRPVNTLTDINLRLQQHDQEQRLERIQQLQQTIQQQQQLQRLSDAVEQLQRQQMNISGKIHQLVEQQDVMLDNITTEIRNNGETDRILVQQHYGGTNFFSKTWAEFKSQLGHVDGNYWIGNERLHLLTKDGKYKLRVDLLAKHNNQWYWAEYTTMTVFNEASGYTLNIGGYYGNAGDSLSYLTGRMFSAKDSDRDMWAENCAAHTGHGNGGGFWYHTCAYAYLNSPIEGGNGFTWHHLPVGSGVAERKLLISRLTLVLK